MALIEATDDYFSSVSKVIRGILADTKKLASFLLSKYASIMNTTPLNTLLIDHHPRCLARDLAIDPERD